MGLVQEGSLGELESYDPAKVKAEMGKEILNNLFSDESGKIVQNTEFKRHELPAIFALELVNHVLIKGHCHDKFLRDNFQAMIDKNYQVRVSLDRQGRAELKDMLKQESQGLSLELAKPQEMVK